MNINEILEDAVKNNASDIHLQAGLPVFYRIAGIIKRANDNILNDITITHILSDIVPPEAKDTCRILNERDFSYE